MFVMAREVLQTTEDKARLLRSLAFHVHRKRSAEEVLREYVDQKLQNGQRREYRPVDEVLSKDGFVAALGTLGLIGEEAAVIMAEVVENGDHRLVSSALGRLADHWAQS